MPYNRRGVPYSNSTSSKDAADKLPSRSTCWAEVYRYIAKRGAHGATCEEVEMHLAMRHQTASARIRELVSGGRIRNSGGRRENSSERTAIVWVKASQ